MIIQVVHGSCCSRTAGWGPPLILAVFAIRIGNSKALFVIRVETIVRIVFLRLVFLLIVLIVILVSRIIILVVQVIFVLFCKCLLVDLFAKLTDDVLLLKSVGHGEPRTPASRLLDPFLGLIVAGGKFVESSTFSAGVRSIGKLAQECRCCLDPGRCRYCGGYRSSPDVLGRDVGDGAVRSAVCLLRSGSSLLSCATLRWRWADRTLRRQWLGRLVLCAGTCRACKLDHALAFRRRGWLVFFGSGRRRRW